MEQIGSEYNFNTGGSIKALNDLIVRVGELDKQVQKLGKTTKSTETSVEGVGGKAKKTKKDFDALGNSINQVTREFPAFAFSAQTGFLALSNNIPILFDSISELRKENAKLVADGKASIPVFKQVAASLFSWQTAVSLLVSFTVMYGKEIGNFIITMFNASNSMDSMAIRLDALNEAYKSKELKTNIESLVELRKNLDLAQDGYVNKQDVLKTYNEQFGKVLGTTNDVNVAEQNLIKATPELINAYISRAASTKLLSDASQTVIDIQQKRAEVEQEGLGQSAFLMDMLENQRKKKLISEEEYFKQSAQILENGTITGQTLLKTSSSKELKELENKYANQIKLALDFSKQSEDVLKGAGIIDSDAIKKALTEFEKLQKEESKLLLNIENGVLAKADISKDVKKLDIVREKLKSVQDVVDLINGKTFEEALKQMEEWGKEANAQGEKDLKERRANEKKSIEDGLLAIEMEYAKKKEEKVLNTKEELELERGKQLAMISYLNEFSTMDEEVRKDIFKRMIKLSELNSKINEQDFKQGVKNEKDFLDAQLNANGNYFLDLRNEREYSAKELAQIDVQEAQSKVDLYKFLNKEDKESKDRLLKAEQDLKDAKIRLAKETNKEVLDDDKKASRERQQIQLAFLDSISSISSELFSSEKAQLQQQTSVQIAELDKQKEAKLITEEQYNAKKSQLQTEQARKQREYDLAQIKINTALAIMKALATASTIEIGVILAALAGIEGAVQYGIVAAQPLPQFAKGTDMVKGGIRGKDSVHALLMPQEAVIPTKENLARPGLAKAWIDGNLDRHLMMNYIKPAIDENNRRWEATLKVNQSSTFIRNDNFNDKRIVSGLDRINRKLSNNTNSLKSNISRKGLWN